MTGGVEPGLPPLEFVPILLEEPDDPEDEPPVETGTDPEDEPPVETGTDPEDEPPVETGTDPEDEPPVETGTDPEAEPPAEEVLVGAVVLVVVVFPTFLML